ncbi:EKC/KEOPS complex subunit BUD32 [Abortiporus biennis]
MSNPRTHDATPRTPPPDTVKSPPSVPSKSPESPEGTVATVAGAQSTPVAIKSSSDHPLNDKAYSAERRTRMATDMVNHWAEIPLDKFMSELFPADIRDTEPTAEERKQFKNFNLIKKVKNEKQMYPILCEGIQSAFVSNQLSVKDTGEWTESTDDDTELRRTDLAIFRPKEKDRAKLQLKAFQKTKSAESDPTQSSSTSEAQSAGSDSTESKSAEAKSTAKLEEATEPPVDLSPLTPETWYDLEPMRKDKLRQKHKADTNYLARLRYAARTSFAGSVAYIEVKYATSDFAFGRGLSPNDPFIPTTADGVTPGGEQTRGQLTEYASEMFRRQHRTFVFSVSISRDHARFIRWDRQGAVVSESFSYVDHPEKLHRFFYKLDKMNDTGLGYDPTASVASIDEADCIRKCRPPTEYQRHLLYEATKPSEIIYKVSVGDGDGSSKREFLVGGMMYTSPSVIGRGSKVSVAYDMKDKVLVLLKDVWRIVATHVHPEHEVYARLKANNVPYVANLVCGGDVGGDNDTTVSQHYLVRKYRRRKHYRLALKEIGCPLSDYKSEYLLACYIYAVLTAHQYAWEDAHILHRDISPNNIVLVETEYGDYIAILIDWDLCKYEEDMMKPPTQYNRSGTYVFMSALLLNFPTKRHEVSDDLESFIHLVNWFALDHHKNSLADNSEDFTYFIKRMYEAGYQNPKDTKNKPAKLESMETGRPGFKLPQSPGLQGLITALMKLAKGHYATVDIAALEAQRSSANPAQDTPEPLVDESISPTRLSANVRMIREQRSRKSATTSSDQLLTSDTIQQCDTDPTAIDNSSSMPASSDKQPPSTPSGWLYNHEKIVAIFFEKIREAEREMEEVKRENTMPLPATRRPLKDRKWLNSKLPHSQIDQLPSIQFHTRRSSFFSYRFSKRSSTDDNDDNDETPSTKRFKKSAKQAGTAASSSGANGLHSVEEEQEQEDEKQKGEEQEGEDEKQKGEEQEDEDEA